MHAPCACLHVHAATHPGPVLARARVLCLHRLRARFFFRCVHHVSTMYGGCMHGVSCVDVCVNGRGSACTVLCTHACAPVGLHTAYIHTYSGRTYTAHTRGVRVRPVWCVCTRVRAGLRARFFFVCAPHTSSHTCVRASAPKSHRGSARVGWHARPREGGARTPT